MSTNIRQKIMTALEARLATILIANGYETDLGQQVKPWIVYALQQKGLPAIVPKDKEDSVSKEIYNAHRHELLVELEISSKGETTPTDLRKMIADVIKAIGTDIQWIVAEDSAIGDFTASNDGGDLLLSIAGNTLVIDDIIQCTTTDTLPTGLALATNYYVVSEGDPGFKVSATRGGSAVAYTDVGTGTHTATLFKGLAISTELLGDEINIDIDEQIIGGVKIQIKVIFETVLYDAYTQH